MPHTGFHCVFTVCMTNCPTLIVTVGPPCQRQDLHLQEADPLSELDRRSHQRCGPHVAPFHTLPIMHLDVSIKDHTVRSCCIRVVHHFLPQYTCDVKLLKAPIVSLSWDAVAKDAGFNVIRSICPQLVNVGVEVGRHLGR